MTKPTPTQIVVERLLAAGIAFDAVPNRTKIVRHRQTSDNLLVHYDSDNRWTPDLYGKVPGHEHKYGRFLECSLADPVRDLAKSTIYVYQSTWIHGRYNWPELRLSTQRIADRENKLLLTLPVPSVGADAKAAKGDERHDTVPA